MMEPSDAQMLPLSRWMGSLPDSIRSTRSMCNLAFPCCHNAGARNVKCILPRTLAGYVGEAVARLPMVESIAMPIASGVAVCQRESIGDLLRSGVRGLDFRVCMHEDEIHISHTVICDLTLVDALQQVAQFLKENTQEVALVLIKRDWDHPDFDTDDNWTTLQACVLSIFEDLLIVDESEIDLPILEMCRRGRRALVMIQTPEHIEVFSGVSLNSRLETSWRDSTKTVDDMVQVFCEWHTGGRILPEQQKVKLLEVALPGAPWTSAPQAQEAFRNFIVDKPFAIGANLDFPDEATIRAIVAKNLQGD